MPISKPIDLTGQVAVVTGAARGIGRQICLSLADYGADIVVFDVSDPSETVERVEDVGSKALGLKGDVTEPEDVKSAVDSSLDKFGKIDILVNNAGIAIEASLEDTTLEEWKKTLDVNLTGSFLFAQEVFKHMKEEEYGKMVFIGSIAGMVGSFEATPAYGASKAGIHALVKSVAKEGAPYNVYSNGVAPAPVKTELTEGGDYSTEGILLGRMGDPKDVAEPVAFLASQQSNYITGEIITVDGGYFLT